MQKLAYAVVGLVAVLIVIGLSLPRTVRVDVSETIDAPPATVFAQINDFRRMILWSPLVDADPDASFVFSGARRGVGARMTWNGTIIGAGSQLLTESRPPEHVATVINPDGPGTAISRFDLSAIDGKSRVSWQYEADNGYNIAARYFGPVLAGIVEREHRAGLDNLRQLAENLPAADFGSLDIELTVIDAADIAYMTVSSAPDPRSIGDALAAAYFEILTFVDRHGLAEAGAPMAISRSLSGSDLVFDAAIPVHGVSEDTPRNGTTVRVKATYAGPAIRVTHRGPYRELDQTHRKIAAYLAAHGIRRAGPPWESYVSELSAAADAELETDIYYPVEDPPDTGTHSPAD